MRWKKVATTERRAMNEIINFNSESMTVSARELHEKLNVETRFNDWFDRMCGYGFTEGTDFYSKMSKTSCKGGRPATDYDITIDMAKEICMIQRTPEGKRVRKYLIDLEKAWNTPELVMARGLKAAQLVIEQKDQIIKALTVDNERMKPKAEFFDAVTDSKDAISMADVAKVLDMGIGRNKLFSYLREKKILMSDNKPYQEYIDRGYFRVIEQKFDRGYGETSINFKTLVFQKGVDHIRKMLQEDGYGR